MGFRNPITTAVDPLARQAAGAAQTTANQAVTAAGAAQTTANQAATAAGSAATAAAAAQTTANQATSLASTITTTQISDGAVSTPKLAAGAVTAAQIAAGTITAGQIAANTITAGQLAANTITAGQLAATAIDGQTVTGATIRTAASGQRVQLDSTNGLVGFNAAGTALTQLKPDGTLTATSAVITGTLDTGTASTAPGVKVYNRAGNPATGAVELRTGTMDTNARLQLTGGGSGGSALALTGGASNGVTAPELDLSVESAAAGGYVAVARLRGGDWIMEDGHWLTANANPSPVVVGLLTGWSPWNTTGYKQLRFTLSPDGLVTVSGLAIYNGGGNTICAVGGRFAPAGGAEVLNGSVSDTPRTLEVNSVGLQLHGALPTVGQWVSVNGSYLASGRT